MAVMGGSLVAPILPSMIGPLGTSREAIGLILSVYTLFAVIFTPVLGMLADRIGRKKVLIPIIILYGLSGLLISFTTNFAYILILRALQGIGVAGMMSLGVTLIGDLFRNKERATAMGYRTSAQNIATAIIPFVAGALAAIVWFYPFFIYSLAIPLGIVAIFKLKIQETKNTRGIGDYLKSTFIVLKNRRTIWVFLSNFLAFILLYCLIVYLPILLSDRFSLSVLYAGLAVSVGSAVSAVVASQSGKLMHRFSKYLLMITGFLICGLALFLIPFGQSYFVLILFLILWGIGFGTILPTLNTLATELAPIHLRAGVVSGFVTMMYVGQTVSPPLFGLILKYTNLNFVFISASIIALIPITIVGYSFIKKENKQKLKWI